MFLQILWLIIELVAWNRLHAMYPEHRWFIGMMMGIAVVTQIWLVLHSTYKRYKSDVEVELLVRDAEDEMELAMRDDEHDATPLNRYKDLGTKNTAEMTADELLDYAAKLHRRY